MFNLINFNPREYQVSILETCKNNNTLVVLPTGIGKTAIALLLGLERLNKFQDSKILLISPTKPLCQQHINTFKQHTNISHDKIILLTGLTKPEQRTKLVKDSLIIIATPQTIQKDFESGRINLKEFSMLCIDEAHRSRQNFANTHVTKAYLEQATNPRILALTASPGGTLDKIKDIMKNLNLEAVEIRSEQDKDVKQYVQKREIEWFTVELTEKLRDLYKILKDFYLEKANELKKLGFNKPLKLINKSDLLMLQNRFRQELKTRNNLAFYGISLTAQLIKIDYALELLEVQGLRVLSKYFEKLKQDTSKAAKTILNNKEFQKAINLVNELINEGLEHPKFNKLKEIILEELKLNSDSKIMIFANYRDTVSYIAQELKNMNIKVTKLIGQKEGLSQKEQINIVKTFEESDDNVLVGTSIMEEGLDIKGANTVIFYEAVASEIRKIQRAGRVARLEAGKIIFLITKNTRDEAYFWSGYQKEKRMKKTLYNLKDKNIKEFLKEDG
ncbi:MAG: DEAD/DEAH box helicase [Nanoarchaeota archaeon]